ncbi:MAG: hypothetical protein OXU62_13430 [Gammaproteobacteria bacterium]|nr:hypothetical protein [Gammaproteobacteria bacterium]
MGLPAFDTLSAAKELQKGGEFSTAQAELVTHAIAQAVREADSREEIVAIKKGVVGLKTDVAAVKEDVVQLKADNRILKAGVARVEDALAATATKDELNLVKKDVEHIKETMATSMATKAELADVKADIAVVKKDVDHIKETMATKVELAEVRADVAALKKDVGRIEENMLTEDILTERLHNSTRWLVGTIIAVGGLAAAVVGLV